MKFFVLGTEQAYLNLTAPERVLAKVDIAEFYAHVHSVGGGSMGNPDTASERVPEAEFFTYGTFFPNYPMLRPLNMYEADDSAASASEKDMCTKKAFLSGSNRRVLFIMTCARCSMVLGFAVLDVNESPQALFQLMFTRFLRAPARVVYDNACNAQMYCMKREPAFFKDTMFVIDRLHARGHSDKSCSRAFHPKYAMGDYDDIAGVKLNTQACEQVNSCMVDIAQQAKYMSAVTYLFAIRDFLGQLNGSKPGTGRWKSVYSGLLTQDV